MYFGPCELYIEATQAFGLTFASRRRVHHVWIIISINSKHKIKIYKKKTNFYQSIITSGYTMFLVTGSFKLLSHIALIFQTDVTQEAAT